MPHCNIRMKVVSVITETKVIDKILRHQSQSGKSPTREMYSSQGPHLPTQFSHTTVTFCTWLSAPAQQERLTSIQRANSWLISLWFSSTHAKVFNFSLPTTMLLANTPNMRPDTKKTKSKAATVSSSPTQYSRTQNTNPYPPGF